MLKLIDLTSWGSLILQGGRKNCKYAKSSDNELCLELKSKGGYAEIVIDSFVSNCTQQKVSAVSR